MNSKLETLRKDRCRGSVSSSFEKFIYIPCRGIKGEELGMRGVIVFERRRRRTIVFLASGMIKSRELGEQV